MNNRFFNMMRRALLTGAGVVTLAFTACNPEPDESDLYTFTGQTIGSFIQNDSTLSSFNYILSRVGYDNMMEAYGSYTCFAPTNEGVAAYCDSLYNDTEASLPHNGMTENSLQGLTDSLCLNIVRYHLTTTYRNLVSLTGSGEVSTMLGYNFSYSADSLGNPVLNGKATIISSDHEVTNGLVHVIDNVVPRFTRFIGDVLERNPDKYSIFSEAFKRTGWVDSVLAYTKGEQFEFIQLVRQNYSSTLSYDTECKVGFTVFAESDEVMRQNNINSFDDLVAYANNVYGSAPDWYDYMSENALTVSTGNDYTNPFNALNMFVAYHILGCSMSSNQLVFEKGSSNYWNYAPDADPYDYYETKLPHTLLKIWEPVEVGTGKSLFINRYQTYNTLTNEVGTKGTNHTLVQRGAMVDRSSSLQAYNGYVHGIDQMLVYDRTVPKMVLNERMRFNCTTLFPELITNGYRYWSGGDGNIASTYDTSRRGIPKKSLGNIKLYNEGMCFVYALHGAWRCYQCDQLQYWGNFDFAFKLPPVPSGLYELRIVYPPVTYGAFMQYYIGTSSNIQSMVALGIPYDISINAETDPSIGWTKSTDEEDQGIATDVAMHNRGFMRAPYSFCGHGENGWSSTNNCRVESGYGTMIIRAVLGRVQLNQGTENWLRIKKLVEDNTLLSGIDFIEVVPVGVVDSQEFTEDWY